MIWFRALSAEPYIYLGLLLIVNFGSLHVVSINFSYNFETKALYIIMYVN